MRRAVLAVIVAKLGVVSLLLMTPCNGQVSVLTQRNDATRNGLNANETVLTLSSVSAGNFGKLFDLPVDGYVYAQPLYVPNVVIPGNGTHNVVYAATQHDTLFAYDADGQTLQPLWKDDLAAMGCPSSGWTCAPVPYTDNPGVTDIVPEIGITSTPVIDPSSGTIYVVAKTKQTKGSTTNYVYQLHALDITTGAERVGSPVIIQGQVAGSGTPNSNGFLVFSPQYTLQRASLTLVSNGIYFGFGSWGDSGGPCCWHGWIFGYDRSTLAQLAVFSVTPNGWSGGVWMHGAGLAADSAGYLYFSTGNGAFDGITSFGDSYLKLATPSLTVSDYFTPYNQQTLSIADLDVASGSITLLPDSAGTAQHPHIMIGCGKNGAIYVLDRDSMGQFNSSGDTQIIQELLNVIGGTPVDPNSSTYVDNCFTSPAYWEGHVYFGGIDDSLKMFNFSNGLLSSSAVSQSATVYQFPGTNASISANGGSNGIVWTNESVYDGTVVLHAYDATNLSSELYNSSQVPSDAAGAAVKFTVPTIANGKVYIGTQTSLAVYGLLNLPPAAAPSFNIPGGTYSSPVTVTITEATAGTTVYYTLDGSTPTTSSNAYTAPITIGNTTTLSAMAVGGGYRSSPITSATYVILGAPTLTSVSPSSGPAAGGTAVTITGANFVTGATLTLGGTAATNVVVVSATQITATAAAHAAGAVNVVVTNPNTQSGSLTNGFIYVAAPTVTSVSPNSGPAAGGTAVTITGANFASGATVTLGGTAATNVVVVSGTQITVTTAAHAAGAVNVVVTNPDTQSGSLTNGFTYTAFLAISFAQVAAATPQSAQVVPVAFPGAQTAGDLNVVAVGWTDTTSTVSSVVDSQGNTYSPAIGPTSGNGVQQSIYYAKHILAGNNTVTVTFNQAASYPDVRILEYQGLDANNPLDVTAGALGNSSSASSGAATTTSPNELIFGAGTTEGGFSGAGMGFTTRIITSDVDIAEDQVVSASGSYSAVVPLDGAPWVMQMATFKAASLLPAPTMTSMSPTSGPAAGGTAITLTGTNFASGATVTLGGTAATNVVVVSATQITATTAAHAAGAVTLTVTNPDTQSASLTNGFTYVAAPTLTSVSPTSGPAAGGTVITLAGTNFVTGATVTLGSTAAINVVVVGGTQITATTPANTAGVVNVVVTNPDTQSGTLTNGFTYTSPTALTVTSVSPSSGPAAGGTAITLTGTNFASGATVTLGGTAATNVVVVSATQITATTAAHAAGAVNVVVTNPDTQSASLTNGFTYLGAAPTLTSVSPTSGPAAGGTAITLTGTNFASGATVTLGGTAPTNVVVVSASQITATTAAHAAGAVNVVVTNPDTQSASLTNGFTYLGAAPTLTSVSPTSGPAAGGTAITLTGTNFASGATVTLGGTAATNVVVVSASQITATTAAHAAGTVNVVVTNPDTQNGTLTNGYTYSSSVAINFAQVAATTLNSAGQVTVVYPGAQTVGNLNAVVVGWNDTTSTVQSVTDSAGNSYSLAIGPTSGTGLRQSIYYAANIKGGNNTVTVTFNQSAQYPDIRILEYQGVSAVDVKAGASGNSGTANSGTATTTTANELIFGAAMTVNMVPGAGSGFTARILTYYGDIAEDRVVTTTGSYSATAPVSPSGAWVMQMVAFKAPSLAVPTLTNVSPTSGPAAGGTAITLTGTNFASGATVTLGGTAATNVVVVSASQITATTAAHAAGAVNVVVTNPDTQSASLTNGFTYLGAAPTLTNVSPTSGPAAGGTAITLTGTNFASGATVTSGGTAATNVVVVSASQITATTAAHAAGTVNVVVTNPDTQSASLTNGFTYVAAPTLTSVSPTSGPAAGGTAITLTGTNFASGATVTLGGTAATNVVVVSASQITATTAAHAAGTVNVVVTNPDTQSASLTNGFTYLGAAPTLTNMSPTSGPAAGGTAITLTGTNFASGATVTLGGTAATNVVVVSASQITATTAAHAAGAVNVVVTNPDTQSASLTNGFTYVAVPTLTNVSPTSGPAAGGTAITLTGTNFASGATVTLGGTAATNVVVVSASQITATTAAHAAGAVNVVVTNPDTQTGTLANGYTYTTSVAIGFAQVAAATPVSAAQVTVVYPGAQTVGNLNAVVVGWNDTTSTVQSVTDSAGNPYSLAIGPTSGTGLRQSIYYAANIKGGSNTVTVTFNQTALYPDVRILEYRGVSAVDAKAGASGNSGTANSGTAAATSTANELIFGAATVSSWVAGAGNGFTTRIITSQDGDNAEDRVVTTTGSYNATAPVSPSAPWVMQMVTFK